MVTVVLDYSACWKIELDQTMPHALCS